MRVAVLGALTACGFSHGRLDPMLDDATTADMAVAVDASPVDGPTSFSLVVEAENYTTNIDRGANAWASMSDVAGFSGTAFMQVLPNNGTACVVAVETTCSEVQYAISLGQPGMYFLHARMFATTSADDSVWFGIDGVAQATPFQPMHDSTWRWLSSGPFALPAGPHTLSYWHRETGIRLDVLAVTTSATPPP